MGELALGLREGLADRYAVERELGRGGMATVYLARDLRHERPVALKVLHPELAATLGPERFLREIRLAARLQHPHILTVLDSGRRGTGGPQPLVHHALRRGREPPRPAPARDGSSRSRTRSASRARSRDALAVRPRARGRPPGHQAGEHPAHAGRHTLVADFGIARALGAGGETADRDRAGASARRPT